MINGKRIEVLAVAFNGQVLICKAPFVSSIYPGDKVVIEDKDDIGVVLVKDRMEYGGEDYERISDHVFLYKVKERVSFDEMKWDGYEEEEDE